MMAFLRALGPILADIAFVTFAAAAVLAGLALWVAIFMGAKRLFKDWNLYSLSPLAKRLRRWQFLRREARRS